MKLIEMPNWTNQMQNAWFSLYDLLTSFFFPVVCYSSFTIPFILSKEDDDDDGDEVMLSVVLYYCIYCIPVTYIHAMSRALVGVYFRDCALVAIETYLHADWVWMLCTVYVHTQILMHGCALNRLFPLKLKLKLQCLHFMGCSFFITNVYIRDMCQIWRE